MSREVQRKPTNSIGLWAGMVSWAMHELGVDTTPKTPHMSDEERQMRKTSGGELPRGETIDLTPSEFNVINDDTDPDCDKCSCHIDGKCAHPNRTGDKCPKKNLLT